MDLKKFDHFNLVMRASVFLLTSSLSAQNTETPLTNSVQKLPGLSRYRELHVERIDEKLVTLSEQGTRLILKIRDLNAQKASATTPEKAAEFDPEISKAQLDLESVTEQIKTIGLSARTLKSTRLPGNYANPLEDQLQMKQAALDWAKQHKEEVAERVSVLEAAIANTDNSLKEIETENGVLSQEIAAYKTPSPEAVLTYLQRRNTAVGASKTAVQIKDQMEVQQKGLERLGAVQEKKLKALGREIDALTIAKLKSKSPDEIAKEGVGLISKVRAEVKTTEAIISKEAKIREEYSAAAQKITKRLSQLQNDYDTRNAQVKIAQTDVELLLSDGAFNKMLDEKSLSKLYGDANRLNSFIPDHQQKVLLSQTKLAMVSIAAEAALGTELTILNQRLNAKYTKKLADDYTNAGGKRDLSELMTEMTVARETEEEAETAKIKERLDLQIAPYREASLKTEGAFKKRLEEIDSKFETITAALSNPKTSREAKLAANQKTIESLIEKSTALKADLEHTQNIDVPNATVAAGELGKIFNAFQDTQTLAGGGTNVLNNADLFIEIPAATATTNSSNTSTNLIEPETTGSK